MKSKIDLETTLIKADMTKAQLARELGRSWRCIKNWEAGIHPIPSASYDRIISLFEQRGKRVYFLK